MVASPTDMVAQTATAVVTAAVMAVAAMAAAAVVIACPRSVLT